MIVTRGNVDLRPILDSLPPEWEQVVWNNAGSEDGRAATVMRTPGRSLKRGAHAPRASFTERRDEMSVYGRYAAVEYAHNDLIYVQDDDCVVSDPRAIVDAHLNQTHSLTVACNMPEPWASNPFYERHALVGFGAAFHRDAPKRAFRKLLSRWEPDGQRDWFHRTCDIPFTFFTPQIRVQVPHESFAYASGDDRMWRQPSHQSERQRMLDLCERVAR